LFSIRVPKNISYFWNFGSILRVILILQILSRLFLTIFFVRDKNLAFYSVLYIQTNVNFGWFIRFIHANGASTFLLLIFIHICRGLYYFSFNKSALWASRVTILLLVIGSAFLGYVLPWGQISFWGATVITNLISAIPVYRVDITCWIWRGFSVVRATLTRFYTFHFLFPLLVLVLIILHLFLLHVTRSSNPNGIWNFNKLYFYPFYFIKDLISFILIILLLLLFSFSYPLLFIDADNWILSNPIVTPTHIKPEWYFLFAYAILRCIPSKRIRVLILVLSITYFYILSFTSINNFNFGFKLNFIKFSFILWCFNFILLTYLGRIHVIPYYVIYAQYFSILYFTYLILLT